MLSKINEKHGDLLYFILRILTGILFFMHGAQKFTGAQLPNTFSLFWWAGVIEITVGPAIILGVFTRLAALIGAIEMLVAYLTFHSPKGINPFLNGGELAILYFSIFLVFLIYGARKWAIDETLAKNQSLRNIL